MRYQKRSASSNRWLRRHFNDKYVQQAHKRKLRSRAWFKLDAIQQSDRLFTSGMTVIDLGSAPGGWSQYARTQIGASGRVIACDILSMDAIFGVEFLQGDFCNTSVFQALCERVGSSKVQVIMSDMAPNISGIPEVDIPRSMYLVKLALNMCRNVLTPGGSFLVKIFQGEGFEEYLKAIRSLFTKVRIRKPDSSHIHSREMYVVASERNNY